MSHSLSIAALGEVHSPFAVPCSFQDVLTEALTDYPCHCCFWIDTFFISHALAFQREKILSCLFNQERRLQQLFFCKLIISFISSAITMIWKRDQGGMGKTFHSNDKYLSSKAFLSISKRYVTKKPWKLHRQMIIINNFKNTKFQCVIF